MKLSDKSKGARTYRPLLALAMLAAFLVLWASLGVPTSPGCGGTLSDEEKSEITSQELTAGTLAWLDVVQDNATTTPGVSRVMTFGVPLASTAATTSTLGCRLVGPSGTKPAQCRPLAMWDDTYVKWARVDFVSDSFSTSTVPYRLEFFRQFIVTAAPLAFQTKSNQVDIKTARLALNVRADKPGILLSGRSKGVQKGVNVLGDAMTSTLKLVDSNGRAFDAVPDGKVAIEENGTEVAIVRVDGTFVSAGGERLHRFEVRFTFGKGLPNFTVEPTLIVTSSDTQTRGIQSLRFETEVAGTPAFVDTDIPNWGRVAVRAPVPSFTLQTPGPFQTTATKGVDRFDRNERRRTFLGALSASSSTVGVGLRGAHDEYPKQLDLRVTAPGIYTHSVELMGASIPGVDHAPMPPPPLNLQNPLLTVPGYNCIVTDGTVASHTPVSALGPVTCQTWGNADQRTAALAALRATPNNPILLAGFTADGATFAEFLRQCSELSPGSCRDRRLILDSKGYYNSTARGLSKSHRIDVVASPLSQDLGLTASLAAQNEREPFIRVPPAAILASKVLGTYKIAPPPGAAGWDTVEAYMAEMTNQALASDREERLYGNLVYGAELNSHAKMTSLETAISSTIFTAGLKRSTTSGLFNQESNDALYSAWWLYLRSGSRDAFEYALKKSRYLTDVATVWDHADRWRVGLQRRHSMLPYSDDGHTSHTLTAGTLLYHYLTGNARARQAAMLAAEASLMDYKALDFAPGQGLYGAYQLATGGSAVGGALRGQTAMWLASLVGYELTRSARYRTAVDGFARTLVATQGQYGGYPDNMFAHAGQARLTLDMPNGQQGTPHSLSIALDQYRRLFPNDAAVRASAARHADYMLENHADRSFEYQQANGLWMMAEAYSSTGNPKYLSFVLTLLEKAADPETLSAVSRYYLPREVGHIMAAYDRFRAGGGTDDQIFAAWGGLVAPKTVLASREPPVTSVIADEGQLADGRPLRMRIAEARDTTWKLRYDVSWVNKNSRSAAVVKLLDPRNGVLFCREYYMCTAAEADAGPCAVPAGSGCPAVLANRATVTCNASAQSVYVSPHHFNPDYCDFVVAKDGQAGDYVFEVTPIPGVASNLKWKLATTRPYVTGEPILGGSRHDSTDGNLRLFAIQEGIFWQKPAAAAADIQVRSTASAAGVYRIGPDGRTAESASLLKAANQIQAEPSLATLPIPAGAGATVPLSIFTRAADPTFHSVQLSLPAGQTGRAHIGGLPVLSRVGPANGDFEAGVQDWLSAANYGAGVSTVQGADALEGTQSLRLVDTLPRRSIVTQDILARVGAVSATPRRFIVQYLAKARTGGSCYLSWDSSDGTTRVESHWYFGASVAPLWYQHSVVVPPGTLTFAKLLIGTGTQEPNAECTVDSIDVLRVE